MTPERADRDRERGQGERRDAGTTRSSARAQVDLSTRREHGLGLHRSSRRTRVGYATAGVVRWRLRGLRAAAQPWPAALTCPVGRLATAPEADPSAAARTGPAEPTCPRWCPASLASPPRPSRPGETVGDPGVAHADIAFMQMMVLHHRQALDMAALVPAAGRRPAGACDVADADRGRPGPRDPGDGAVARPSRALDVPPPDADPADVRPRRPRPLRHAGHAHPRPARRAGRRVRAEFDELFLEGMIAHHEGAIAMALDVLSTAPTSGSTSSPTTSTPASPPRSPGSKRCSPA